MGYERCLEHVGSNIFRGELFNSYKFFYRLTALLPFPPEFRFDSGVSSVVLPVPKEGGFELLEVLGNRFSCLPPSAGVVL